jgi:hypothetical protein
MAPVAIFTQFWDPFTDDNFQLAAHLQPSGKEKAT